MSSSTSTPLPVDAPLVTLHRPSSTIWHLELHNGADNRLTEHLINSALMPALDLVEKEWRATRTKALKSGDKNGVPGALIISGRMSQDKFFSNGLDFAAILKKPSFHTNTFNPLLLRLLLFPIPTIAAINGHAFAGGWLLATTCDYRVMIDGKKRNAWACMNEVQFGAPWPRPFAQIFRAKGTNPQLLRKIALEGHRFTPSELLENGMVDALAGSSIEIISKCTDMAKTVGANATHGVWGLIKKDLYNDVVEALKTDFRHVMAEEVDELAKARL